MDAMSYDFPSDHREASAACKTLGEQIAAFPMDEVTLADGTPFPRRRPAEVYTPERAAELKQLRAERLAKATLVVTHDFWGTVPAEDQWKARSALKHDSEDA